MDAIEVCAKCKYIIDGNTRYRAIKELINSEKINWPTIKVEYIHVNQNKCFKFT